jgi:hypothetical protein
MKKLQFVPLVVLILIVTVAGLGRGKTKAASNKKA